MAESVLFNIATEILTNLGSRALDEIASTWKFKDQLEKLKDTITVIRDLLVDVDNHRQTHSETVLQRLKAIVYEADDLFDEFATLASQKELMGKNRFTREVRAFFSQSNQVALAFSISRNISRIREKLDDIVKDGNSFAFMRHSHQEQGIELRQRDETYSFVDAQEVIGRSNDTKSIIHILLGSGTHDQHVSVVPIVGIGGLGKTTLAQLISNDDEVVKHFDLQLWVCVSDNFDIKEIVRRILMSATNTGPENLKLEQLQKKLQAQIIGKRYLLVLDDVWNENREEWLKLRQLLNIGREGSKILVTTRSLDVAKIMGTIPIPYALKGLSEEESWSLFKKMAFEPRQENEAELAKIGREIVKKCANVPLAIRTLGSLLYGKNENKWLDFKNRSLAQISEKGNNIMGILKLSYDQLWFPLKNCFAYCALFPKDYVLEIEMLINLWMAQGFVVPTHESQSLLDAVEDYFLALSQRGFFQEITTDKWGNIKSCKMHDLMHDLSVEVAGTQSAVIGLEEMKCGHRTHHLSFGYSLNNLRKIPGSALNLKLLRTFLLPEQIRDGSIFNKSMCIQLLPSYRRLRVLDLHNLGIKNLPSSIGKLFHLRYLNLSMTPIKALPNSITKLQNLKTLEL